MSEDDITTASCECRIYNVAGSSRIHDTDRRIVEKAVSVPSWALENVFVVPKEEQRSNGT